MAAMTMAEVAAHLREEIAHSDTLLKIQVRLGENSDWVNRRKEAITVALKLVEEAQQMTTVVQ